MFLTDRVGFMHYGWSRRRLRFPTIDSYFALLYYLGVKIDNRRIELKVSDASAERAQDLLNRIGVPEGVPILGIAPGAAWGKAKCWLPERFAEVAEILCRTRGVHPLLFCGPGEEELVESIERRSGDVWSSLRGEAVDLELFMALVGRCKVVVTNDSGPRHVAAGMGVPAVVIFGPTQQELTYIGRNQECALQSDVECGPCQLPVCPTDHACMKNIAAKEVAEAVIRMGPLDES